MNINLKEMTDIIDEKGYLDTCTYKILLESNESLVNMEEPILGAVLNALCDVIGMYHTYIAVQWSYGSLLDWGKINDIQSKMTFIFTVTTAHTKAQSNTSLFKVFNRLSNCIKTNLQNLGK